MPYPYEAQLVDRSDWPSGEWDDEIDKVEWTDSLTGYDCAMVRHSYHGHWCGYVKVPKGHPLEGLDYNDQVKIPSGWMERSVNIAEDLGYFSLITAPININEEENKAALSLLLFCHGGLTYGNNNWLGFDCSHAGDYVPGAKRAPYKDETYKNSTYVRANCERLAKQIYDYAVVVPQ